MQINGEAELILIPYNINLGLISNCMKSAQLTSISALTFSNLLVNGYLSVSLV